ncbi:hypothetical protein [Nocardioides euryhalodurans]|uniref:Uncharacterized protein n=1 Tax=Nocardioides euryhalodurans TaxID=2518370 RepID=A0A4P7GPS3_9ACTN|nr:hypothetical protein [Nocardioides euryhalodurans]QBR93807.1 hypothetical protein EXE57_17125 [Nocardioides euryhalodurans]
MVETTVTARLLGVRVLRRDGVVLLAPAGLEPRGRPLEPPPPAPVVGTGAGGGLERAQRLLRANDTRLRSLGPARSSSSDDDDDPETPTW